MKHLALAGLICGTCWPIAILYILGMCWLVGACGP